MIYSFEELSITDYGMCVKYDNCIREFLRREINWLLMG
jgi:hypothetical protein